MGKACVLSLLLVVGCGGDPAPAATLDLAQAGDLATAADSGLKAFGEACAMDSECQSDACFLGGNRTFCSIKCTVATAATDCPVPPTTGTCNMQGYCKAP